MKQYFLRKCRKIGVIIGFGLVLIVIVLYFMRQLIENDFHRTQFNYEFNRNISRNLLLGYINEGNKSEQDVSAFNEHHYSVSHDKFIKLKQFLLENRTSDSDVSFLTFEYVIAKFNNQYDKRTLGKLLKLNFNSNSTTLDRLHYGIKANELYAENDPIAQKILHEMATGPIASIFGKTNTEYLRLMIEFENGNRAVFMPMRSQRDDQTKPEHLYFMDVERHNAQIATFHLDRLLGFRHTFPVVGRKLNMTTELYDKAFEELRSVFFKSPAPHHQTCFYDKCDEYCDVLQSICGNPDTLEGSLTVVPPELSIGKRTKILYPWKRSYVIGKKAEWEDDENYCEKIRSTPPYDQIDRILDIMDLAILDFLIGNHDRREYELFDEHIFGTQRSIIYADHGRAFGNPYYDDMLILAPIDQCCLIRDETMATLIRFHNGRTRLSVALRKSLRNDPLAPILWDPHFHAIDRRIGIILDTVDECIQAVSAFRTENFIRNNFTTGKLLN